MNKNRDIHLTLITWIIPVYNGERFIEQAIRSILNQPCKDLKVVVIDDGSEDLTAEIVKGINDDRVQYVYKENGGVSSARNSVQRPEYGNRLCRIRIHRLFRCR